MPLQEKNIKHNGNLTLEDVYEVARVMRDRSCAAAFAGTVKEMLGTCVSGERCAALRCVAGVACARFVSGGLEPAVRLLSVKEILGTCCLARASPLGYGKLNAAL